MFEVILVLDFSNEFYVENWKNKNNFISWGRQKSLKFSLYPNSHIFVRVKRVWLLWVRTVFRVCRIYWFRDLKEANQWRLKISSKPLRRFPSLIAGCNLEKLSIIFFAPAETFVRNYLSFKNFQWNLLCQLNS